MARSCYSTQARFFYDVLTTNKIIWYWADPLAPWFTGRSVFTPLTLSNPGLSPNFSVGEQSSHPRPWRNGSIPMASPSGVLDGNPEWFYTGQSVNDPGLARTAFGIPLGCASLYQICGGAGLNHFTWLVTFPDGSTPSALTAFYAPTTAEMTWTPPIATGFLACGEWATTPPYTGPALEVQFAGLPVNIWAWPVQIGPEPSFRFQRVMGAPPDNTDLILTWQPGP
jgi:hypothetical protein